MENLPRMTRRKTTFCYVTLKIEQSTRDHHFDVLYQADKNFISSLEVAICPNLHIFFLLLCLVTTETYQNQQAV